jgi:hypothetical protein
MHSIFYLSQVQCEEPCNDREIQFFAVGTPTDNDLQAGVDVVSHVSGSSDRRREEIAELNMRIHQADLRTIEHVIARADLAIAARDQAIARAEAAERHFEKLGEIFLMFRSHFGPSMVMPVSATARGREGDPEEQI